MKTNNANRLADPENLYIQSFRTLLWTVRKKVEKIVVTSWRPFWLSVESWTSNQAISILLCNGGGNGDIATLTNRSRLSIFEFDLDLHDVCHCQWFTGIKMQMSKVSEEAAVSEVSEMSQSVASVTSGRNVAKCRKCRKKCKMYV